ncbi:MAG: hypothetical protein A4S16_05475 [Proteobacteria bacterium SG_bin6]|nr:MAG: hypothetical protein A4S16_05475 [Proteobacteria bacterium SG_bin6]
MTHELALAGQSSTGGQRALDSQRIAEFYDDNFVTDQVRDFEALVMRSGGMVGVVADVGGGCGYFSQAIARQFGLSVRVLDSDPKSIEEAREKGLEAMQFDALAPSFAGDEGVVCFNLILHHLVGETLADTRTLQARALANWRERNVRVFVNEYIYDSPVVRGASAWLIGVITSSRILSAAAGQVGRFIPSLRANTLGVGVRFRDAADWRRLFHEAGYQVLGHVRGAEEPVSLPRRMMGILSMRRDSFLLGPVAMAGDKGAQ